MEEIIRQIEPFSTRRQFKKRAMLLYQGESPRMAFVLISGIVKMYSINAAGEEQIAAFHTDQDIFPASWVFGKAPGTLYYYEALSDVEVLTLPREVLAEHVLQKPELLRQVFDYFVKHYTGLLMRITALEQSRAREKILYTLYYLLFRYGEPNARGMYIVELSLTHALIASLVGLTRETTTTELNRLKRQKILSYDSHQYGIDKARLEKALGEESFDGLDIKN